MTNVSVMLTPDFALQPFSALSYIPWSFLSSNRDNERAKIYLPAYYYGSPEDIVHSISKEGIQEIRFAFSMPPSDELTPSLIMETPYASQTPRDYLMELIKNVDTDTIPTNVGLDLMALYSILKKFHAHHLSFKSYPHQGTSQESPPILTTAFNSSNIDDVSLLISSFGNYHFNFEIYSGDFPSYETEPTRAYDGTIIVADVENADGLVDRIKKALNPEIIIVTREELVGTKRVFAKSIL